MINKIDDGTASLAFEDFCLLMREKTKEIDPEILFKDTFRVFSKDEEGRGETLGGGGFLTIIKSSCDNNSSLVFTLIIQCFIVLKLIVFKGNIWTKSAPVDRLRFLPDDVIPNLFCVKFIKKLSNGLIDIHLIVPPNYF